MKNFLIDLCLVGMLIFMINGLFNDHGIQKEVFNQNLEQFEETIENNQIISSDYGSVSDSEENTLSLVVKEISDGCIKVIKTFVLIISNIISSLF